MSALPWFAVMAIALAFAGDVSARKGSSESGIVLLKRVAPAFPLEAYTRCVEGYVLAEFTIDPSGVM